jgi:hypothetical protein
LLKSFTIQCCKQRIADQVPRDPFEAELLMMAEMVAEDKKGAVTSESDDDDDRGNVDMGAPSPIQDDSDDASPAHTPAATSTNVFYRPLCLLAFLLIFGANYLFL